MIREDRERVLEQTLTFNPYPRSPNGPNKEKLKTNSPPGQEGCPEKGRGGCRTRLNSPKTIPHDHETIPQHS